jgi:cytochrome c oxidase cbb3-type subunit 1
LGKGRGPFGARLYGVIATYVGALLLGHALVRAFLVGRRYRAISQLAFPDLNPGRPWRSNFGRSASAAHLGGCFCLWRQCPDRDILLRRAAHLRVRLFGGNLAWFVFWGYQLFIVMAATGYLLGITQSREYAEPEWYVDIWLTIVWVAYLVVFLGTILKRKEPHIYVANWFYLSFIVTIAMLHIVNNLAIPVSFLGVKSYSAFSGVQDALTQWWYGHNAVGFFLTAGFLGMMYYFVPKQAEPSGLFLPPVDHPLLVAHLHVYLGWPAPPALHGAARLGADAGHGVLDHAVDAVLGRHDQRSDDAFRRLGQGPHRPDHPHDGWQLSPSTAWRPSKAR